MAWRYEWTSSGRFDTFRYVRARQTSEGIVNIEEIPEIEDTGGTIEFNDLTTLKASAKLPFVGNFNIGHDYLRIYSLSSLGEEGDTDHKREEILHGTFICSRPSTAYTAAISKGTVECYSLLKILEDVAIEEALIIPKGADAIGQATLLISSAGLACIADESHTLLTSARSYEAGTNYLEICNDLMGVAGFDSLEVSPDGTVLLVRYETPSASFDLELRDDTPDVVFGPEVVHELDIFDVPNKVIAIKSSSGDEAPLTAVALNQDPESIYSVQNRGRTITHVESVSDVGQTAEEELSLEEALIALQAIAERTLTEKSSAVESIEITHPYLPYRTGETIKLVYTKHGLDFIGTAVSKSVELKTPGMPCKTRIRRFVRR